MASQALAGLKVVEFGAYAAGPCVGKHLANFGATVVHVESRQRPDGFRLQYPPYRDGVVGINRSGCFAMFNDSKYAVTLNLKAPGALGLARRLAAWGDVLIENMTPGTIARLGLGYEELSRINPGLIMLSTCNMGQTGPRAEHPGFGTQLSALSGFAHLTGFPDGPPQLLYGPYIDFIAVAYGGVAVLAALEHRRRTGRGQYIDLAQYETGIQFIAPALLDHAVNGRVASRQGNRSPEAAPHGAYPCRDGAWIAVSCWSDEEWGRLCQAAGHPEWAVDERYATLRARKANEDGLDRLLEGWTAGQDARELMAFLQENQIHAGVLNTMGDLFSDPQLAWRRVWQERVHPEMGAHHYRSVSYELSRTPSEITGPAPCLGEHSEYVYREVLGLGAEEYESYVASGVID